MIEDWKIGIVFFVLAAIGITIGLLYNRFMNGPRPKRKKWVKSKNKLTKNNEFVIKNKEEISKAIDYNTKELKSLRRSALLSTIFIIVGVILAFLSPSIILSMVLFMASIIVFGVNYGKYSSANEEKYIELVKQVLQEYDSELEYKSNGGFTKSEYHYCLFPETCDRLRSEDRIDNNKNSFTYADILVQSEHEDSDGDKHFITEFQGALARINIKNVKCRIFLGSTSGKLLYGDNTYQNLKFENDEFNKLFRACTDSELLAYKLLTPDVMEEFVNIKNSTYGDIDIRIIEDKLYIRFLSGDTFDSTLFNKKAEKKKLLQSIAVLEEVMKTMDKVKKIIDNKIMD